MNEEEKNVTNTDSNDDDIEKKIYAFVEEADQQEKREL